MCIAISKLHSIFSFTGFVLGAKIAKHPLKKFPTGFFSDLYVGTNRHNISNM